MESKGPDDALRMVQDDLNLHILCIFEGTVLLDAALMVSAENLTKHAKHEPFKHQSQLQTIHMKYQDLFSLKN